MSKPVTPEMLTWPQLVAARQSTNIEIAAAAELAMEPGHQGASVHGRRARQRICDAINARHQE